MLIIGHRGSPVCAPENTMKGFKYAWKAGADGIELDIHLTADQQVVVFHDLDGRRLLNTKKAVAKQTWSELSSWRIAGEPIPLLAEVLAASPSSSLSLIEIKALFFPLTRLHDEIRPFITKPVGFLTFNPLLAVDLSARFTDMPVYLNLKARHSLFLPKWISYAKDHGLAGLSIGWSWMMSQKKVEQVRQAGLSLALWTINDPAVALKVHAWGADLLVTDDPVRMKQVCCGS